MSRPNSAGPAPKTIRTGSIGRPQCRLSPVCRWRRRNRSRRQGRRRLQVAGVAGSLFSLAGSSRGPSRCFSSSVRSRVGVSRADSPYRDPAERLIPATHADQVARFRSPRDCREGAAKKRAKSRAGRLPHGRAVGDLLRHHFRGEERGTRALAGAPPACRVPGHCPPQTTVRLTSRPATRAAGPLVRGARHLGVGPGGLR
jgi:hypothetical protein